MLSQVGRRRLMKPIQILIGCGSAVRYQCPAANARHETFRQRRFVFRLSGQMADERSEHPADAAYRTISRGRSNSYPLAARMVEDTREGSARQETISGRVRGQLCDAG